MALLNHKHLLGIGLVFIAILTKSQNLELPLSSAGISLYSGKLYCFGLEENKQKTSLIVYQLNHQLETLQTKTIVLMHLKPDEKIACWSDTLHGLLTVYVSEGRQQKVSVVRFDQRFELLNQANGVDISRINSLSGFDNELYYENLHAYAVKTKTDTSGKQFYLNKYKFKESAGSFDYTLLWQFPFERKNISFVRVLHANNDLVILYAVVNAGEKAGQWILKINAKSGYLLKGTKLNDKGDENTYCFGQYYYDKSTKNLMLIGHKFTPKQLPVSTGVLAVTGSNTVSLYINEIDSVGNQVIKQDVKLAVQPSKPAGKNNAFVYLLQIKNITKKGLNNYQLQADVYKSLHATTCFTYANSFYLTFHKDEENYLFEKKIISSEPLIDSYLSSNDRLDMNGKLCQDSSTSFYELFYKNPSMSIKLNFNEDSLKRPRWVLCKSNTKKGSINYSLLSAGKKTLELKTLEDLQKSSAPASVSLPGGSLLIGRQQEPAVYKLTLHR